MNIKRRGIIIALVMIVVLFISMFLCDILLINSGKVPLFSLKVLAICCGYPEPKICDCAQISFSPYRSYYSLYYRIDELKNYQSDKVLPFGAINMPSTNLYFSFGSIIDDVFSKIFNLPND